MALATKYDPTEVESKWYEYWLDNKLFHSEPDGREAFTIVIPPPNVTGVLHMGHILNNTIQDILTRRARMEGKNACWVPGTDHASIATEAKVVARLAEKGIKKTDLTREEFLKHAWEWTDEHGGIILKQLRTLGCSCDWDRTAFTMDAVRSESVLRVFVDLYKKGLIYRGVRMVNWDPKALTALSDEEVIYKEQQGKLYYLRYQVEGSDDYAVVATTRPETIMGDTAMCIHPENPKTAWLKGKRVIVPLVGRSIPVIEDEYVDPEFGTGCLKVTPAHDVNDYLLGEKYRLPSIDIFNDDGTISEAAGIYIGKDRFAVRKEIVADLEAAGLLDKTEEYTNKVGYSERTSVPIEPKLSMQWFLRMESLAKPALEAVMSDDIRFYPAKYKNTYRHWMENIKDWCISRQLWWGHQIPAYYLPDGTYVVAATAEDALTAARTQSGNDLLALADLRQDEDCLDTWFSSWLWPISLFDGINNPNNKEVQYYYPTADLVTAPDIIFFWVARMIMAGYEYESKLPFRNVYFTGIVRDKQGRKMSKSLGNSPEPLELIAKYGADGVRMGMMLSAPAGNDILFDDALCEQGRNFNNKIWNAFRLVQGWQVDAMPALPTSIRTEVVSPDTGGQPEASRLAVKWFDKRLQQSAATLDDLFSKYRISEALMEVYKLFWDEFSAWYLEIVKPSYGQPIDRATYDATLRHFDSILRLLHPFMPFITEELWQALDARAVGESIMTQPLPPYPCNAPIEPLLAEFEEMKEIVAGVRNIRNIKKISPKQPLTLIVGAANSTMSLSSVLMKIAGLEAIVPSNEMPQGAATFRVGTMEYAVPLAEHIDVEAERQRLEAELSHKEAFLASVTKKLSNERFVASAPEAVVALERKKQADAEQTIATLRASLATL